MRRCQCTPFQACERCEERAEALARERIEAAASEQELLDAADREARWSA